MKLGNPKRFKFFLLKPIAEIEDGSQCSLNITGCRQGELLGMRDRGDAMEVDDGSYHAGTLAFDDGGMRGLAAAICWIGLVYRCSKEQKDELLKPDVKDLIDGLLSIPTIRKRQSDDPQQAMINRIVKQNVDSKKLAVSSFEWSQILAKLSDNKVSAAEAIKLYNDSPEVVAHGGSSSKDSPGDSLVAIVSWLGWLG